jgi:hypothetical protein
MGVAGKPLEKEHYFKNRLHSQLVMRYNRGGKIMRFCLEYARIIVCTALLFQI